METLTKSRPGLTHGKTSKNICDPTGAASGEEVGDIIEDFFNRVHILLQHDFHQPSRTHIVFCPSVGRRGLKGFGDFAEEARQNFEERLRETLANASKRDIGRWRDKLLEWDAHRIQDERIKITAAQPRMGEYSLGLDPEQARLLQVRAGNKNINCLVVSLLKCGVAAVEREAAASTEQSMRERVLTAERACKEERRKRCEEIDARTVRMDPTLHARLKIQAQEIGIKLPELCRYILERQLETSSSY
jgi:hypothetical protein